MILITALALAAAYLVLAAPSQPVARLRRLTSKRHESRAEDTALTHPADSNRGEVDIAVILDLLSVALKTGSPIPDALEAVGSSIDGVHGADLTKVSAHLMLGSPWQTAWEATQAASSLEPAQSALAPAWLNGAPATALLDHAKRRVRQQRAARDKIAAKQLGARLILPVTVCYLPAFIAIGLLPVVLVLVREGINLL